MVNTTFSIPGELPLQKALRVADSFLNSPERQEGVYGRIKATEERIHGYRRTALEIDSKRPEQGFFETLIKGRQERLTLEKLIEKETYIGGMAFSKQGVQDPRVAKVIDRFWLSHKGSSAVSGGNHLGDWYYVRELYDTFGRKLEEITIHLETHPTHINKIVAGKPVALSIAELEIFIRAIELYEQNIRESLYPLDQEIFDLFDEIDQENIEAPQSLEDQFGKDVVARVAEAFNEYKRTKAARTAELNGQKSAIQSRDDPRTRLY
jgi:hypothetical protein